MNGRDGEQGLQGIQGPQGIQGMNGQAGANGLMGDDGPDGLAGKNALVDLQEEPAGSNCAAGGTRVSAGLDLDGNGQLDPNEVTATNFVCSAPPTSPGGCYTTSNTSGNGPLIGVFLALVLSLQRRRRRG